MKTRMLCTRCFHTAVPETLLAGSDRLELLAWLCLALPGLLYCALRHLLRRKLCPHCGSADLVREAHATAVRVGFMRSEITTTRIRSARRAVAWPAGLTSPRERLRRGSAGLASAAALAIAGLVWASALEPALLSGVLTWASGLGIMWWKRPGERLAPFERRSTRCAAWDAQGRPLPIERLA
ncbi:MAG: hypothetical protein OEY15_06410 [Myxococcales bacterium]|nr:hypothetical protein [Myxococcales bacterium]